MLNGTVDRLVHSTVRIEAICHDASVSVGTGFYMRFNCGTRFIPVIITNKHVIKGASIVKLHYTTVNAAGFPDVGNHQQIELTEFVENCVDHPDPKVDLTAYYANELLEKVKAQGYKLSYCPLTTDLIPSDEERSYYSSMEDVVMIGYPNGIWDATNNLPVIRKGITATHPNVSWNGKSEFITDIASFPGSSGSPVFLVNIGGYIDYKQNVHVMEDRVKLLGIHYAGAVHSATGEIKIVTVPTSNKPVPITQIPNNIGVAINSKEILELEREVLRLV